MAFGQSGRADGVRRCVSNYYFSPNSPTGTDYFNITAFSARPEQKLLRIVAWADSKRNVSMTLLHLSL